MIKKQSLRSFAENDIDRVVHFAAESHVDRSIREPGSIRDRPMYWEPLVML